MTSRPIWEVNRQPGDPSFLEWLHTEHPKLAEDLRFQYKSHVLLKRLGLLPNQTGGDKQ